MTVLIVVHNSDLGSEIASRLRQDGHEPSLCTSVGGPEFLKQFPQAALLITDLSPLVLRLLTVNGQSVLAGPVPVLVLASAGHREEFAAMLPAGSGDCLAIEPTPEFIERACVAVRSLVRATAPATTVAVTATKQVSIDQAHRPHTARTARRALHRQDRFVSNIAHDLRTPLTAIYEFARLMTSGLGGEINDQQRRYVGIIERRCQEAARLLDDLLDGAKLQSGRIHPHRQAISLGEVLADVHETLEPVIRHSGVGFSIEVADGLPRVFADRDMLSRILGNLVSNALKFSPCDGVVTVRAERQSVSLARISVIDSGDGIAPDELRRIFRPFEQGPNRARSGVGLGLSIVRDLVRLHGGRVTAESTPGKGSRFHFTLPLFIPAAIVRRHLTTLAKRNAPPITAWSFTCPQPERYDAIHRLISCSVHAGDLVLPDDADRRIVLCTQHKSPELLVGQVVQRIQSLSALVPTVHRLGSDELNRTLGVLPAVGQISNLPGLLAG